MANAGTENDPVTAHADGSTDLQPEELNLIVTALEEEDGPGVRRLVDNLHHADAADLLERVPANRRQRLVHILSDVFNPLVLSELDDTVRDNVIDHLGLERVAEAVAEMETDDAVDLVEELNGAAQREILDALSEVDRSLIEEGLSHPEDSAGRLMQRDVVALPQHWSVGQAIDYLRETDRLPQEFFDLFLVDPAHRPIGTIPLSRVLRSRRPVSLSAIMSADIRRIPVAMDQEEVAFLFRQRDLVSAPVIDKSGRLVGVITVDDVLDVIDEEHEEDIMRMGGVGPEDDLHDTVFSTTRDRFVWLFVHLLAAFIASSVISLFAGTIKEFVALAILMPIVAAMGGTAGIQALTVTVRAIAMKELTATNTARAVGKEVIVGSLNGVLFAIIIGGVASVWFSSPALGGVIALAIVCNLVVAGFAGSALPVLLQQIGIDPAVASSALLISITDVFGFYVFLGLAALLLL